MEDDSTKNSHYETGDRLPDGTADIETKKPPTTSKDSNQKPNHNKNKKWTLRQHWQRASSEKRAKWIFEGVGGFIALLILVNYVWQNLQTKWNFDADHSPHVVFSRTPEFMGNVSCDVTNNVLKFHTGAINFWLKNIKSGDADAFLSTQIIFVPEDRTGLPAFENVPAITNETCKQGVVSSSIKEFPVNGGQQVEASMAQSVGMQVMHVPITQNTNFQIYMPSCVYYLDKKGVRHATCHTYRMSVTGGEDIKDATAIACINSPISGTFEETFFSYCEN